MKQSAQIFAALFFLGCDSIPAAANQYRWHGHVTEEGAALSYAIANSDGIKIDFHCERRTRKITVTYEFDPKAAKDKDKVFVRLALRGREPAASVTFQAAVQRLDLNDAFIVQGETQMSLDLRRILSEGGTLHVAVNGQTEEFPLAGIAKQTRFLFAACPS